MGIPTREREGQMKFMALRRLLFIVIVSSAITGCSAHRNAVERQSTSPNVTTNHEKLHAVLWLQQSAEFKACALQAYHLATLQLDQALNNPTQWDNAIAGSAPANAPLAIIVDIDETILDNTPEEARFIKADKHKFDKTVNDQIWTPWIQKAKSDVIAGTVEFFQYVKSKDVKVFYVTNRGSESDVRANLELWKFPLYDNEDTIYETGQSGDTTGGDKEFRRQLVGQKYRVLMLIGDDLADFISVKGATTVDARLKLIKDNDQKWGDQWIIIPDPAYGSWERVYYPNQGDDPVQKKLDALRDAPNNP
jgi:5'-nucleotidase (lipoprotein e(P4) family)